MDWQEALRERLQGQAGVMALCRAVSWHARNQAEAGPQLVLHLVSDLRPQTLAGFTERRGSRVQFDALAAQRGTAKDLREAVIAAIAPPQLVDAIQFGAATEISARGSATLDGAQIIYRESFDAIIWHN